MYDKFSKFSFFSYVLIFNFSFFLTGCSLEVKIEKPKEEIKFIQNNEETKVGEIMVSQKISSYFNGMELLEKISNQGDNMEYVIEPNLMNLDHLDENGNEYYKPKENKFYIYNKLENTRSYLNNDFLILKNNGEIELENVSDLPKKHYEYKKGKFSDNTQLYVEQQIIYNGTDINNNVYFTYREFNKKLNSSLFKKEFKFNLAESNNIIKIEDFKIKVFSANLKSIEYKILF